MAVAKWRRAALKLASVEQQDDFRVILQPVASL